MNDIDETTKHRKNLYFEYREAITEVEDAVEPFVDSILKWEWAEALADQDRYQPENAERINWIPAAKGKGWGQFRTSRWETAKEEPERLDIHWEHKPRASEFKGGTSPFLLEL